MAIDAQHGEYRKYLSTWKKIIDITDIECVADYLIKLNPQDRSEDNKHRNEQYRERAIFYPIAADMLRGMHSILFSEEPQLINLPPQLEYLKTNCDGQGNSISQQSRRSARDLIRLSRSGISITFPKTDGAVVSKADINNGSVFATIQLFDPRQIINWRVKNIGSKSVLSLVVVQDKREIVKEDGYETEMQDIILEMFLDAKNFYSERIWIKDSKTNEWKIEDEYTPLDGRGKPWNEIPFTFIGAMNNDQTIDNPGLLGMVNMNIGHYRNSADYEDSVWFCGQAQPWMSGITQDHINMLKDNNMYIGSRNLLGVPSGESFGFAVASPNVMVRQAMLDKVDMMIMMGARMVKPGGHVRTATEVDSETQKQHSAISLISANLSAAYTKAIQWCGRYMNVETPGAAYQSKTDFETHQATSDEIRVMIEGFIQGAIPASDYHDWLKENDLTDKEKTLDQFLQEVHPVSNAIPNLNSGQEG